MPTTTPKLALPYPLGTDPADAPAAFQALAEDIENKLAMGSFSAYRGSALSVADDAVVVFNVEEWDASSWYDTATGRFTPQVEGIYRLSTHLSPFNPLATGKFIAAVFTKNGSDHKWCPLNGQLASGTITPTSGGSVLVEANGSTDYFQVRVEHDVGGSLALSATASRTYFQGELVGPV